MCVLLYLASDRPHRVLHCRLPGSCQLDDWIGLFIGLDDVFRYAPTFDAL